MENKMSLRVVFKKSRTAQVRTARVITTALVGTMLSFAGGVTSASADASPAIQVIAAAGSTPFAKVSGFDSYTAVTSREYETFTVAIPLGQLDTTSILSRITNSRTLDLDFFVVPNEDTLTVAVHIFNNETATIHLTLNELIGASQVEIDITYAASGSRTAPVPVSTSVEAFHVALASGSTAQITNSGQNVYIKTTDSDETFTVDSLNGTYDIYTSLVSESYLSISENDLESNGSIMGGPGLVTFQEDTVTVAAHIETLMPSKFTFTGFRSKALGRGKIQSLNVFVIKVSTLQSLETVTVLVGGNGVNGDGSGASSNDVIAEDLGTGSAIYSVFIASSGGTVLLDTLAGLGVGAITVTSSNPETATATQLDHTNQILINGIDTGTAVLTISMAGKASATLTVNINDVEAPIITATNGTVRVDALGSWTGRTATALDNGGLVNLSSAITVRYKLAGVGSYVSLESATAHLATVGETVTVFYDLLDHAGNAASQETAVFTSTAVPAQNAGGGGLTFADEEKIRLANEKAAAEKAAAEKAAADAAAAQKLAEEKAAAERAAAAKADAEAKALLAAEEQKKADAEAAIRAKAEAKAAANTGKVQTFSKSTKITLDLADMYYGQIAFVELVTKVKGRTKITVLDYFVINKENGTATSIVKKLAKGQRIQVRVGTKIVFRATI